MFEVGVSELSGGERVVVVVVVMVEVFGSKGPVESFTFLVGCVGEGVEMLLLSWSFMGGGVAELDAV